MGNLFSFQGRFDRATYWKYAIVLGVVNLVLYALFFLLAGNESLTQYDWYTNETRVNTSAVVWLVVFGILALVPAFAGLAVSVRRWHDLNKSGTWVLISVIPVVGPLYAFVMQGFVEGTPDNNAYGPPKSSGHDETGISERKRYTESISAARAAEIERKTVV